MECGPGLLVLLQGELSFASYMRRIKVRISKGHHDYEHSTNREVRKAADNSQTPM